MKRFLKTSSKDGIDYSDKADRGRFELAFALVAGDQANAEKGMDQLDELFSEADRMVRAMKGVQPPAKPVAPSAPAQVAAARSEEHTSELQSLMRISYAGFCLKKKNTNRNTNKNTL